MKNRRIENVEKSMNRGRDNDEKKYIGVCVCGVVRKSEFGGQ